MHAHNEKLQRQYKLVAQAIDFIRENANCQPSLEAIAKAVGASPYHLQRVFAEWAGISPKRFLQYLTKEHAKARLAALDDVLSASHAIGLSGGSRLHDLMITCEAMTPGEYKSEGQGLEIHYGFGHSPFGEVFIGWTKRGVCYFAFCQHPPEMMLAECISHWRKADFIADASGAEKLLQQIFPINPEAGKIHLMLRGTNFQIKVWEALIQTDFGAVTSYQKLAEKVGQPKAQRAVGSALAANHIGFLIPCHRVIRGTGDIGNFRWGTARKLAMLAWEAAQTDLDPKQ